MAAPTDAFERIYAGVFEPLHKRFCGVWEMATGEPADSAGTKISVFTLIGQVVYFRLARQAVLRRMGWKDIGPAEVSARSPPRSFPKARLAGRFPVHQISKRCVA